MTEQDERLCPDWIFSNNSDVHVAVNRGWFKTYVPFRTTVGTIYSSHRTEAVGIGTVHLPVKTSLKSSGKKSHATLILTDVLHVPSYFCNVLGMTDDFDEIQFGSKKMVFSTSAGRTTVALDPKGKLMQPKISGPPVGPVLGPSQMQKENTVYMINARWSMDGRNMWKTHKEEMARAPTESQSAHANTAASQIPPYTAQEKAFLKKHYKDEFHFLLQLGLRIFNDEDREDGRLILRAMMRDEAQESSPDLEEEENDFEGHMVDYLFSEELGFIERWATR